MTNNHIKKDTCPKFPVEYVKFHQTEAFNFQLNRLYSWGGVDKEEIFSVAKTQHCQFGNTKLVLDHIINWLDNVK